MSAPTGFLILKAFVVYSPVIFEGSYPAHNHAALVLFLLVVVRFVAHSDFLSLNFSPKFAVGM